MPTVHVQQDFSAPPERVFSHLAEHENLGPLFGMKVERLSEGEGNPNGVGSVRKLSVKGLMPFEETITKFEPGERIEYRITKGSPLRDHYGRLEFAPAAAGGTHLDYTITFRVPVPGVGPLAAKGTAMRLRGGLRKLAKTL